MKCPQKRGNSSEILRVYGSIKRICVQDSANPNSKQTLNDIKTKLLGLYPSLAPLTP